MTPTGVYIGCLATATKSGHKTINIILEIREKKKHVWHLPDNDKLKKSIILPVEGKFYILLVLPNVHCGCVQ